MLQTRRRVFCNSSYYLSSRKRLKSTSSHISFSSDGKELIDHKLPLSYVLSRRNPNDSISNRDNINREDFLKGTLKAVETLSKKLSSRDIAGLSRLVTTQCLLDIRENILERLPVQQFSQVKIDSNDIFLNFISSLEETDDGIRVTTVTYSLPGLETCRTTLREYKAMKNDVHYYASRNDGILKREHMDARRIRKAMQGYEDFNMPKQLQEHEFLLTSYTFERVEDGGWKVVSFSHTDAAKIWGLPRRILWKVRLLNAWSLGQQMEKYLRYEFIVLVLSFIMFIYLQYLAIKIGYLYEQAYLRRQQRGETTGPQY